MKIVKTFDQYSAILESKDVDLANNRVQQAKIQDQIDAAQKQIDALAAAKIKETDKATKRSALENTIGQAEQNLGKLKQQAAQLMGQIAKDQAQL